MKTSSRVVGLMALSCPGFTTAFALGDKSHDRPLPVAGAVIRPALPSPDYILTGFRGRAMVRQRLEPCQPRCENNPAPRMATIPPCSPAAVEQESSSAVQPAEDLELRTLLEARRDVLIEAVAILTQANDAGRSAGVQELLARAKIALLEAELEFAGSKEDRLSVLERSLEQYRNLEEHEERKVQPGVERQEDYLAAKAARLKAEIDLHKARKGE